MNTQAQTLPIHSPAWAAATFQSRIATEARAILAARIEHIDSSIIVRPFAKLIAEEVR